MWKIGIVKDRARPMLGLHGHHVAFRGLPGVEISALVDSCTEGLDAILALTGAKRHYRTYAEMLDRESLDVVVLCSRHPADHWPQIEAAAARGVHVYCDKPLTVSLREADQIVALAESRRLKICAAHPARYGRNYRTLQQLLAAGAIGTPLAIHGRGKCDHRGGGEDLVVLGTHILDLMNFLFGAPESVWADLRVHGRAVVHTDRTATVEPIGPTAGDDLFAHFRFPGGVRGTFTSTRDLYDPNDGAVYMGVTVTGTRGALSLRFCDGLPEDPLRISRAPGPIEDHSAYEPVPLEADRVIPGAAPLDYSLCRQPDVCAATWILEANRFAAWDLLCAIGEDRQPVSNAATARMAVEMIYGIYASHLSGRAVSFPLVSRDHPLGDGV